jgi:hypothetical protein
METVWPIFQTMTGKNIKSDWQRTISIIIPIGLGKSRSACLFSEDTSS